jgi:hypothetical protein
VILGPARRDPEGSGASVYARGLPAYTEGGMKRSLRFPPRVPKLTPTLK